MNGQEHDLRTTLPIFSLIEYRPHIKIQFILGYMYSMKEFLVARSHTANGSDSGESRISLWGGGLHFGGLGDVTPPKGEGGPGGPPPGKLKKMII